MLTPRQAAAVRVYTFHRFASKLLRDLLRRKKDKETGRSSDYNVCDDISCARIIEGLLREDAEAKRETQQQQEQAIQHMQISEGSQQQVLSGSRPQQGSAAGKGLGQECEDDSDDNDSDVVDAEKVEQVMEMVQVYKVTQMQQRLADSPSNRFVRQPGRERVAATSAPWVKSLAARYEAILREKNLFDFPDLMMHAVRLLQSDAHTLKELWEQFEHVLVDEAQDIDELQYALLCLLTSHRQRLFVVGDIDQAIYTFRGGNTMCLQSYVEKEFSLIEDYQLRINYRSRANIIELASRLMSHSAAYRAVGNKGVLSLLPTRPACSHAYAAQSKDDWYEAEAIAETIKALVHPSAPMRLPARQAVRRKWGDFAILYRKNTQAAVIQKVLQLHNIPCTTTSGSETAEEYATRKQRAAYLPYSVEKFGKVKNMLKVKLVRTILSNIRAILNPANTPSLQQAFLDTYGYGIKTWQALEDISRQRDTCPGMVLLELAGNEPKERPPSVSSSNWGKLCAFARLFWSLGNYSDLFNNSLFGNIFTQQRTTGNRSASLNEVQAMRTSSGSGSGSGSGSESDGEAVCVTAAVSTSARSTSADLLTPMTSMGGVLTADKARRGSTRSSGGSGSDSSASNRSSSTEETEWSGGRKVAENLEDFIIHLIDRASLAPELATNVKINKLVRLDWSLFDQYDVFLCQEHDFDIIAKFLGPGFTRFLQQVSMSHTSVPCAMSQLVESMTEEYGSQGQHRVDEDEPNAVRLMTIHKAKGLEFPVVFIAGVEDGMLPVNRSDSTEGERNLLYVGITRTRDELFFSCCSRRWVSDTKSDDDNNGWNDGKWQELDPSPFLVRLMADCNVKELVNTWQHLVLPELTDLS